MNKKNNRKGFTIVELVIVIAVIAILAAVLIPTFGNVIDNANRTAAVQEAKNLHTEYVTIAAMNGQYTDDLVVKTSKGYYVTITDGATEDAATVDKTAPDAGTKVLSKANGALVYECQGVTEDATKDACGWCNKKH